MKDFNRRRFLGRLAATVAVGLVVPTVATAEGTSYVAWWYYKQNKKTGVVTQINSGSIGPYTQTEAQTAVTNYLGKTSEDKDFRYFYKARVK